MKRTKLLIILAAAMAILVFSAACVKDDNGTQTPVGTDGGEGQGITSTSGLEDSVSEALQRSLASIIPSGFGGLQQGILVTGTGTVTVDPDLALLNLGVQVTAGTVKEALDQANTSLNAMLNVLTDRGIDEKDTQTRFFNIFPQYDFRRDSERVLIGYQVTNQLSVKIRDLDSIGPVIDGVVLAGGDPVVINGISFTVEDTSALTVEAREAAVRAAMAQAEQFAELTGVELGKLVHISQAGGIPPVARVFAEAAALDGAIAPTPVRPGEMEVSVTVQAFFSIQ